MTFAPSDPHASSQSSSEVSPVANVPDIAGKPAADAAVAIDLRSSPTNSHFGARLRAAREARGENLDACAHTLHLSTHVLRQLEADSYAGTDSKIYLASYISKYARHLGIDEATVQAEIDRIRQAELPLVASGGMSHSRFLLDRYATAATYVVLTAVIIVPMIWFGVRGTLDRDLSHLAPLDAAPVAQQDARPALGGSTAVGTTGLLGAPRIAPPVVRDRPLMASMAAFPGMDSAETTDTAAAPVSAPTAGSSDGHNVNLNLSASSWVEVTGADGSRMEYGLLPAGSNKTYHSDQPLDVRIGNASGAQLSIDGQAVALEGYRRANVAHLRVQIEDGKAVPASL